MKPFAAVLVSAVMFSGSASAQRVSAAASLDSYIAPLVELDVFSGAIAVAQGDSLILQRYYGSANIEHDIRNGRETVFRIASISKPFTRALVGRLADKGLLALDDKLSRWMPSVPSAEKISVRMLLDHRAGIPSVNSLPFDEEAIESNSLAALVDSISKRPLDYEPGTRRSYSNGGYAIIARIIELATRESYDSVLTREILRPLGMSRTRHESNGMIIRNAARGYMPAPDAMSRMVLAPFQEMDTKTGGGSLVSSVDDLVTWMRAIGKSDILSNAMWAELFPAKDSVFGFQGRSPGFNSYVEHDRKRDRTTVVLANNYAAGLVADIAVAADRIADGKTPFPLPVTSEVRVEAAEVRSLTGFYLLPAGALPVPPGTRVELRLAGDHAVAYIGSTPVDVLLPQGNGRFLARALWSIIEASSRTEVDSIVVRALYADRPFTAVRDP